MKPNSVEYQPTPGWGKAKRLQPSLNRPHPPSPRLAGAGGRCVEPSPLPPPTRLADAGGRCVERAAERVANGGCKRTKS